jgi:hypothetical protein
MATPKSRATPEVFAHGERIEALQQENSSLAAENAVLHDKINVKDSVQRIHGRTYINGNDEEICSRCADVDFRAVRLLDMNIDGRGLKATCPHCKTARGNGPPIPRKKAEEKARRIAEPSHSTLQT